MCITLTSITLWSFNNCTSVAKSYESCLVALILQSYLVLLQPFLQQLLAALLQDGPAQLQRLKLVELALVQQNTKVLQQRRGLTWLRRDTLKLTDGLRRPQDSLRGGNMTKNRGKQEM